MSSQAPPRKAFIAAANRAGLDAQVVYTAEVDESKEGVAECLIFSFDFVQPSATIQKASIYAAMQFYFSFDKIDVCR